MAIGPGIFKERYKDYSLEQLNKELEELKKYLVSDELKQARQEEIDSGIDDNNCITNVESEIEAIESLIKEKSLILPKKNDTGKMFIRKYKTDGTEEELEIDLPKFEMPPFTPEESKYYVNISKLLDISIFECKEYSKRIPEENATYYYNPARGGKCVIVSDDGSYLSATSSVNFDRHLEEFKTGRRSGNLNDNEINKTKDDLENIKDFSEEDKQRIKENISILKKENIEYNATMKLIPSKSNTKLKSKKEIFEDLIIKYLLATMATTFYDEINETEWDNVYYNLNALYGFEDFISNEDKAILQNLKEGKITNKEELTWLYEKCAISMWVLNLWDFPGQEFECNVDKMNKILYFNDKNERCFPDVVIKMMSKDSNVLDIENLEMKTYEEILEKADLLNRYKWAHDEANINGRVNSFKISVPVLTKQLSQFYNILNWNPNIPVEINSERKMLKINCHSCNNEIVIDCSKLPTNVKMLDTICPNCKSFIKYGNLNYIDNQNIENSNKKVIISAIEKIGIPTRQVENTILFVSSENAVVDNKKVLIDDKKFNFIINVLEQKFSELKEIKNKQTPEFLNNHISYDNKSKIFNIKYNNEEITINYHTGTDTDKYINDLISLIIDILMKENTKIENEINSTFEQDLNNINLMLKDVENMIFGENKNFELAKEKLLDFVKGVSIFENDNETDYYNFDDVIQFIIYTRLNKTNKKVVWSSIPFLTAYSYLAYVYTEEKNYEEALKIIEKQMKIAPLNLSAYFEKCETYKMQKMWEQFKEETKKIYTKIYDAKDLAHLYRNLGFYYIEQNKMDLAYALYTASIQFEKHRLAYSEMMYINQQLGRENYSMSAEETLKLLDDNDIPFGVKRENVDLLISIYENEKELIKNPNTEMLLASKIYYLSKDSRFAPYYEEVDNTTGCAIIIPRSWKPIKKEVIEKEFGKNQMFAIYTDTNALFQGVYDGKCPSDEFDKAYNLNIENMKKANMNLLYETVLDLKLQKGVKKFKCALFETKGIRIYNCFTLINGIFVNFSINVSSEIDFNDSSKFNNQKNMVDLINVLSSILELNKDNNTGIQKDIKEDNVVNKINSVCEIYKKNNDITKVIDIVKEVINSKVIDPFWLDTTRYAFIYLILKQFNDNQKCDYTTLIEIISDKDKFVKICKEAKNVNSNSSYLSEYASKIINSTDKMIDSYYEIICSCLNVKVETSKNNSELNKLIEDTITNEEISLKETILNIVELIIDLRSETTTTIAELIKYEPEKSFVEPLTQGKVFNYVFDVCKKMNINLEEVDKSFGGLAYYYTFKKADKKEKNNDDLIEHTINSNISFKFKLPKLYGETTKKTDISFKIGNYINVMISKCSDISKLEERSLQWLENSAKTNNQNILKDKVRKYFLNNDTIQVIERMVEKDDQRRMYKFVYLNESMIVFAFGAKGYNEKFENTINNAIISIKEIGNQQKIERDPFEKVNNSNEVDEKVKKYMNDFIDKEIEQPSNIDSEFLEYSKLYKEKFGKNAYIAMPGGTKEQTINAIKECLKRNEDVLDKILYPTFEKDMEDGVLY